MTEVTEHQTINAWEDIENLDINVLRGIYGVGFEKPSPIQSKAILPMIKGNDVIAQAQSGKYYDIYMHFKHS